MRKILTELSGSDSFSTFGYDIGGIPSNMCTNILTIDSQRICDKEIFKITSVQTPAFLVSSYTFLAAGVSKKEPEAKKKLYFSGRLTELLPKILIVFANLIVYVTGKCEIPNNQRLVINLGVNTSVGEASTNLFLHARFKFSPASEPSPTDADLLVKVAWNGDRVTVAVPDSDESRMTTVDNKDELCDLMRLTQAGILECMRMIDTEMISLIKRINVPLEAPHYLRGKDSGIGSNPFTPCPEETYLKL